MVLFILYFSGYESSFSHEPTRHVMVSAFRVVTAEEDS